MAALPSVKDTAIHKEGKPLMEKRRRARINESLSRLKLLVLGEVKRKNPRIAKLDKADVLEMTVQYVNKMQNAEDPLVQVASLDKYRAGFNACADEVRQYLASVKSVDIDMRTRVIDHLANFIQNLQWLRAARLTQERHNGGGNSPNILQQMSTAAELMQPSSRPYLPDLSKEEVHSERNLSPQGPSELMQPNSRPFFPHLSKEEVHSEASFSPQSPKELLQPNIRSSPGSSLIDSSREEVHSETSLFSQSPSELRQTNKRSYFPQLAGEEAHVFTAYSENLSPRSSQDSEHCYKPMDLTCQTAKENIVSQQLVPKEALRDGFKKEVLKDIVFRENEQMLTSENVSLKLNQNLSHGQQTAIEGEVWRPW